MAIVLQNDPYSGLRSAVGGFMKGQDMNWQRQQMVNQIGQSNPTFANQLAMMPPQMALQVGSQYVAQANQPMNPLQQAQTRLFDQKANYWARGGAAGGQAGIQARWQAEQLRNGYRYNSELARQFPNNPAYRQRAQFYLNQYNQVMGIGRKDGGPSKLFNLQDHSDKFLPESVQQEKTSAAVNRDLTNRLKQHDIAANAASAPGTPRIYSNVAKIYAAAADLEQARTGAEPAEYKEQGKKIAKMFKTADEMMAKAQRLEKTHAAKPEAPPATGDTLTSSQDRQLRERTKSVPGLYERIKKAGGLITAYNKAFPNTQKVTAEPAAPKEVSEEAKAEMKEFFESGSNLDSGSGTLATVAEMKNHRANFIRNAKRDHGIDRKAATKLFNRWWKDGAKNRGVFSNDWIPDYPFGNDE